MPAGVDTGAIIKIIVFNGSADLPPNCIRHRFHESRTAGFIHVIAAPDWHSIMHTFVTPREIADYLLMREKISRAQPAQARSVSEKALVGQFLADDEKAIPSAAFERIVDRLIDERQSFDVLRFLNLFGDRIVSEAPQGTIMPNDLRTADDDYYLNITDEEMRRALNGVWERRRLLRLEATLKEEPVEGRAVGQ